MWNENPPTPKLLKSSLTDRLEVATEKRKAASYVNVTEVTKKSKSVTWINVIYDILMAENTEVMMKTEKNMKMKRRWNSGD